MAALVAVAAAAPGIALADGYIAGFYVPSANFDVDTRFGSGSINGDGWGIAGKAAVNPRFDVYGEYQAVNYDNNGGDLNDLRAGVAYNLTPMFDVSGEFVRLDGDGNNDGDNGFGAHFGAHTEIAPALRIFGDVGYLTVGDSGDGFEGSVGAAYSFTRQWAAFADYRYTKLNGDNDVDVTLSDVRVGAAFLFK